MKVLAFTDMHGNLSDFRKLKEKARKEKVSAFVCAGDITFFGAEFFNIIKNFQQTAIPLVIIPGNHETAGDIQQAARKHDFVKNMHCRMLEMDSCLFFGCGGSKTTPFSTPFEFSESQFEAKLKKFKDKEANKFVFLVHEPPYNTSLGSIEDMKIGSKAIRNFIEKYQPDYCICGHFHENEGKEDKIGRTRIINPGPAGKVIEL